MKKRFRNRKYLQNYSNDLPIIKENEEFDEDAEIRRLQNDALCTVGKNLLMSAFAGLATGAASNLLESKRSGSIFRGSLLPSIFFIALNIKQGLNSPDRDTREQYQYVAYATRSAISNILFGNDNDTSLHR